MKRLGCLAIVCVALLTSCEQGPRDCIEAEAYLGQCQANPTSCEESVLESILGMGCDSALGKGEGGAGDLMSMSMLRTPPLCHIDEEAAKILRSDPNWYDNPLLKQLLDEQTSSVAVSGNSVSLLKDGVNSYPRRLENIKEADVVLIKVYNFRDDKSGTEVINALRKKLADGKQVFVSVDVKGNCRSPFKLQDMRTGVISAVPPWLQEIANAENGYVIPANAPVNFGEIIPVYGKDHEKYLMTWKRGAPLKLIMGGMNIGDAWGFGGTEQKEDHELKGHYGFRDTDVEVIGPVTEKVLQHYLDDATYHANRYSSHIESLLATEADLFDQWGSSMPSLIHPDVVALPEMMREGLSKLRELIAEIASQKATTYPASGTATIRHVANKPTASGQDEGLGKEGQYIEKMLCLLISASPADENPTDGKASIRLSNAFFLPPDTFMSAVGDAASRGVTFKMLLNPPESIPDAAFGEVSRRARCLFKKIKLQAPEVGKNLHVFEWNDEEKYEWNDGSRSRHSWLHQKVWSFGDAPYAPVVIGSSNLDYHSLRHNSEGVLLIQDRGGFKAQFDNMLDTDFGQKNVSEFTSDMWPSLWKCVTEVFLPLPAALPVPDSVL